MQVKKVYFSGGLILLWGIIFHLALLTFMTFPEKNSKIADLQKELKTTTDINNKISIFNSLCWEYRYSNPQKGIEYGEAALILTEKNGIKSSKSTTLNFLGLCHKHLQQYNKATRYFLQALVIAEELDDVMQIAYSHNNIGNLFQILSQYDKASFHIFTAMTMFSKAGYKKGIAHSAVNLSILSRYLKKYDKALQYLNQALKIREELKDAAGQVRILLLLAEVYYEQNQLQQALIYYFKVKLISEKEGNRYQYAVVLGGIAAVCFRQQKYQEALVYRQQALTIAKKMEEKDLTIRNHNAIGQIFMKQGKYDLADQYIQNGLQLSQDVGLKSRELECLQSLVDLNETTQNHPNALNYHKKMVRLKESIFDETKNQQIEELEARYQFEQHEKEIDLLKKKAQIKDLEKNLLLVSLILGFIIIIILFIRFRSNLRTNRILKDQKNELEERSNSLKVMNQKIADLERKNATIAMAITVNHEINQPLTVLKGNFDLLIRNCDNTRFTDKDRKYVAKVNEAIVKITCILDKFGKSTSFHLDQYDTDRQMIVFEEE